MKRALSILGIVTLLNVFIACHCAQGAINGWDNFNSNTENLTNWGSDIVYGGGTLTQTNQHVEYTDASPLINDEDYSYRPWILNQPAYNGTNWEVILDVGNSSAPTAVDQVSSLGIQVFAANNLNNSVFVELYSSSSNSLPARYGFYTAIDTNDSDIFSNDTGDLGCTNGAVRLVYNSQTKVFTTYYDAGGSAETGYNWTPLASFGINNSGGVVGNVSWGLRGSQAFQVTIYGFDSNIAVSPGQMWMDNFSAATAATQSPSVTNYLAGQSMTLAWPQSAFNFSLQETTSLVSNSWPSVSQPITLSNGIYSVSIPITGNSGFFRLAK
ncbi:MAG TPA: hypothetical protein VMF08_08260 [Candidatus Sulfotelmatobacter sp.]|nr:hypothetical protein [Candidatus Sulfotelmatobacter sp.]